MERRRINWPIILFPSAIIGMLAFFMLSTPMHKVDDYREGHVIFGKIYEPNFALIPIPFERGGLAYVMAAKRGIPEGLNQAHRCLSNQRKGWSPYPLPVLPEGLGGRIADAQIELEEMGYDADIRIVSYRRKKKE